MALSNTVNFLVVDLLYQCNRQMNDGISVHFYFTMTKLA